MDEKLRKLQLTQVEILKVFHEFCVDNKLKYSLVFGTLLGAVRHKGFIPWDDDLDVCMPRDDYNKFLELWNKDKKSVGYVLVNKDNSPLFTQVFTKIKKEHTTFIEKEAEKGYYHHGIFIDVFPVDRIPDGFFKRKIFQWNAMKYLLFTREHVDPKSNLLVRLVSFLILNSVKKTRRETVRTKLLAKLKKYNYDDTCSNVIVSTMNGIKKYYSPDLFKEIVGIEFEGNKYMCFGRWEECLKLVYGDYMQLPPENQRVLTHHPVLIDFEHSYEELEGLK